MATKRQIQIVDHFIKNETKRLMKEDMSTLESDQSKPVQVGKFVVTVGLQTGNINLYNKNMTSKICQIAPFELQLLLKMSKRKNTED